MLKHSGFKLIVLLGIFLSLTTVFWPSDAHAIVLTTNRQVLWQQSGGIGIDFQLQRLDEDGHEIIQNHLVQTITYEGEEYSSSVFFSSIATLENPTAIQSTHWYSYSGTVLAVYSSLPDSADTEIVLSELNGPVSVGGVEVFTPSGPDGSYIVGDLSKLVDHLASLDDDEISRILAGEPITAVDLLNEAGETGECETDGRITSLPFKFILCPMVEFLFDTIDYIYGNFILPLLIVNPLDAEGNASQQTLYNIWNDIRILANVIFIGLFMLAIIGQAFSWFFTPYELKKILPRLLVAAIFIQLSWVFSAFVVDLFNIIGAGTRSLLLAPLDGIDSAFFFSFDKASSELLTLLTGGITTAAVIYAITIPSIFSGLIIILLPIAIGLLAAVATIVLRIAIIDLMVIFSPLAIAFWALPNTSKITASWWGLFWKSLLVYPIIVALITSGELLARIVGTQGGGAGNQVSSGWESIVGMIALFAPYFLIPYSFQFAGGALSAITGNAQRFSKKMDQRFFGDERTPDTFKYNRKKNQANRKDLRKIRGLGRLGRFHDKKGRSAGAKNLTLKAMKAWSYFGGNFADRAGESRQEAYERVKKNIQSGGPLAEDMYKSLISGDCTDPVSGADLDPAACAMAQRLGIGGPRKDQQQTEAALMAAATTIYEADELDELGKKFVGRDKDGILPIGMKGERAGMWDRMVNEDEIIAMRPDLRYRDPISGEMPQMNNDDGSINEEGLRLNSQYLNEQNSRFDTVGGIGFEPRAMEAGQEMLDNANTMKLEASGKAGDGENWQDHLSDDQVEYMQRASKYYNNVSGNNELGTVGANKIGRNIRDASSSGDDSTPKGSKYGWIGDFEDSRGGGTP